MSGEALYSLRGLRRVFGGREVLAVDELDLPAGLVYGLTGPNGSGKTTLMKLLAFLEQPEAGDIVFGGRLATAKNCGEFRSRVVWSPQFPVMFTGTLRYNVEYPMKIKGVPAADRRARARELLRRVGLADLAEAPARRLSGGEAQRASLARALAAGAEVLLLDEPTANVDMRARGELIRLLDELRRDQGLTLIIATHDPDLLSALADREIRLQDGRVAAVLDTLVYKGGLSTAGNGRPLLTLPPGAGDFAAAGGRLTVTALAAKAEAVVLELAAGDCRALAVELRGEADLALARRLTLGAALDVRSENRD